MPRRFQLSPEEVFESVVASTVEALICDCWKCLGEGTLAILENAHKHQTTCALPNVPHAPQSYTQVDSMECDECEGSGKTVPSLDVAVQHATFGFVMDLWDLMESHDPDERDFGLRYMAKCREVLLAARNKHFEDHPEEVARAALLSARGAQRILDPGLPIDADVYKQATPSPSPSPSDSRLTAEELQALGIDPDG